MAHAAKTVLKKKKEMNETPAQQQKRVDLQKIVQGIEKHVDAWDSVVSQSTQTLSAICNVSVRKITSSSSSTNPVTEIAKLEHYMSQMVRSLELLRDIADKLSQISLSASECFSKQPSSSTEDQTRRTSSDPSPIELLEVAMYAASCHEREYWKKKSIISSIDFDNPEILDTALTSWSSDSSIDKQRLKSMLRRSRGFSTSSS